MKTILFDLWGTLITSPKMDERRNILKKKLVETGFQEDFFNEWVDLGYTGQMNLKSLSEYLVNKYQTRSLFAEQIRCCIITDPQEVSLLEPSSIEVLRELLERNALLGIVSDCTSEVLPILTYFSFEKYFSKYFLSFQRGVTKQGGLYDIVLKETYHPLLMIGDDYHRDYQIPTSRGIKSLLLDKTRNSSSQETIKSLHEILDIVK